MKSIRERLAWSVALLDLIDQRRQDLHDPNFASGVERCIVNRELAELENEILVNTAPQKKMPAS